MPSHTETRTTPRSALPSRRAVSRAVEVALLVALLAVDFELGTRLVTAESETGLVVTGLTTAFVAVVVAVLALARRSLPPLVTVTAAYAVSALGTTVSALALDLPVTVTETTALLVITVVGLREATARGATVVGAAGLLVLLAGATMRVGLDGTTVLLALLIWGCAIAAGVASRYVSTQREARREAARHAERMELARELHDVVAHQVTAIVVQAQALAVVRTHPERVAEGLAAIEAAGAEALDGMRRMVGTIRDGQDDGARLAVPYGLADIPALVDRFDPGRGQTTLQLEDAGAHMPPGVGESAYRVVREALTNVRRHAPGTTTRVSLRVVDAELQIHVSNDVVRERSIVPGSGGYGLTGMAERVDALGGTMQAGPDDADTWSVRVSLPLTDTAGDTAKDAA